MNESKLDRFEQENLERHLSHNHHMKILWDEFFLSDQNTPITETTLVEKASLIGRIGLMLLSCGTGAWRVRDSMDQIARALGITCSADIGLVSLEYTCFDTNNESYSQTLSLPTTGVNMTKLNHLEHFVQDFIEHKDEMTLGQTHARLTRIEQRKGRFTPPVVAFAAGLACAGFIFLLGGNWPEVLCSFLGATAGGYLRRKMGDRHITMVAKIACSVALACLVYYLTFMLLRTWLHVDVSHQFGYIGALLFVIPGFPFITSGLDLSKLDMRSGLERAAYAMMIVFIATSVGWAMALLLHLEPGTFSKQNLTEQELLIGRLLASFCGVFGFSITFNSRIHFASVAGIIGAVANVLRLSLVDYLHTPAALAAFVGAITAGLLASIVRKRVGYPRIALTVPSIVIMVPGLYLYKAIYRFGLNQISLGTSWIVQALMIILALPLGLIAARILTDRRWRHAS